MDNNVDLELSFNALNKSLEKTLKEPKRAFFGSTSPSILKLMNCQVSTNYTLTFLPSNRSQIPEIDTQLPRINIAQKVCYVSYICYFQFKTAWTSTSFLGISMIMNKNSQFTKIFSQAILELKDTGRLKIMNLENSRGHQSCDLPFQSKEKPMGYEKLACLFIIIVSGILISLFIVLFEYIAKRYLEKQNSPPPIEDYGIDSHIEYFLESLSTDEKKVFPRILQKYIETSQCPNL